MAADSALFGHEGRDDTFRVLCLTAELCPCILTCIIYEAETSLLGINTCNYPHFHSFYEHI